MTDEKITQITANTTPAVGDLLPIVDDPSGTPATQRITLENLFKVINGLTADASPDASADYVVTYDASAGGAKRVLINNANRIAQVVHTQTGAVATGTTVIPMDDTIPQNTEGTEFMTLAITPTSATNKLLIEVTFICSNSAVASATAALFQDTTANAIAAAFQTVPGTDYEIMFTFKHEMVAGTTSATTFKLRAGPGTASTMTMNGFSGARKLGGVLVSSMRITEIKV